MDRATEMPKLSRFATLFSRLGIGRSASPVNTEIKPDDQAAVSAAQRQHFLKETEDGLVLEFREEVGKVKTKLQNILQEVSKQENGLYPKRLTDNGDGTFGLFYTTGNNAELLSMLTMNKKTDYRGYFNYKIMERNVDVNFDEKTGEPLSLAVYDVKKMQADSALEANAGQYRRIINFPTEPTEEGKSTFKTIQDTLNPLLESFNKPIIPVEQRE